MFYLQFKQRVSIHVIYWSYSCVLCFIFFFYSKLEESPSHTIFIPWRSRQILIIGYTTIYFHPVDPLLIWHSDLGSTCPNRGNILLRDLLNIGRDVTFLCRSCVGGRLVLYTGGICDLDDPNDRELNPEGSETLILFV